MRRFQSRHKHLDRRSLAVLLGPVPLIAGDDEEAYSEFKSRILNSLNPLDAVEELLADHIVNRGWEIARWRRSRAAYLTAQVPQALLKLFKPLFGIGTKNRELDFDDL